jgi:hypothetical protein
MPGLPARGQLESAFRATLYEFDTPAGGARLRIDEPSAALAAVQAALGVECSGLVTGWNPRSGPRPIADNEAVNARLLARLAALGWQAWPARHVAPQREWDELGLFVPGIGLAQLLELGREFDQHAVLHADDHAVPRLVWCYDR